MAESLSSARRVKVYQLNDSGQWDDKGTGHVRYQRGEDVLLFVRAEETGVELLEHKVEPHIDYQRQGDTIITWCEPSTGVDLALSFQEVLRCNEIWEQIAQAKGDVLLRGEEDQEEEDPDSQFLLPQPTLSNLEEFLQRLTQALTNPKLKESVVVAIVGKDYLRDLLALFPLLEDLERMDGLFTMFGIFKSLFMLNDVSVFEGLVSDENILQVIAALEYDPDHPGGPYNRHRKFLRKAKFKNVIRLREADVTAKIHQNYRITYIKDVILLRYLDDPTVNTLSSMIFYNNVMIVSRLSDNTEFMQDLFRKLSIVAPLAHLKPKPKPAAVPEPEEEEEEEEPEAAAAAATSDTELHTFEVRQHLILFLQELCTLAKTLQIQVRDAFYRVLIDRGVFGVIEQALAASNREEKSGSASDSSSAWLWVACLDILTNIANHDPALIRAHMLSGKMEARDALLGQLVDALTTENVHSGIAHQLFQLLRVVLDSDTMQTADKDVFLDHVYKLHMIKLVNAVSRPIPELVPGRAPRDDETASSYHSCELLSFCFQHHSKHGQRTKSFAIHNNVLQKVILLLGTCKRGHLTCSALRFFRIVLGLKDEKYLREIVKKRLLDNVMELFVANGARYNLINSVIIEMVNFIRLENLKTLVEFLVRNHEDKFRTVQYVQTFNLLKLRWEQNEEYKRTSTLPGSIETNGDGEADAMESERSEYEYFAGSDDENDAKADSKKLDVDDEARFNHANDVLRAKRKRTEEEELLSLVSKRKTFQSIPAGSARARKGKPGTRTPGTSPVGFLPRFANSGKRDGS